MARAVPWDDARAEQEAAPEQDPGLRMEREKVRTALKALPEDQRTVLDLAYFQGLSTAEIASKVEVVGR